MFEDIPNDTLEELSIEEVQELQEEAIKLKDKIEDYRDRGQEIDDKFMLDNEDNKNLTLDDIPYGEEILRTENLPENLDEAIYLLAKIDKEKVLSKDAIDAFNEAKKVIEHAREEFDDCIHLPPEEDDDE